jgi:hypothetical protein
MNVGSRSEVSTLRVRSGQALSKTTKDGAASVVVLQGRAPNLLSLHEFLRG